MADVEAEVWAAMPPLVVGMGPLFPPFAPLVLGLIKSKKMIEENANLLETEGSF